MLQGTAFLYQIFKPKHDLNKYLFKERNKNMKNSLLI
jgi:hypothetical protein